MENLATKEDLRTTRERLERKMDAVTDELRKEIRHVGRETTFSLAIIMGVLNTITFTALELC